MQFILYDFEDVSAGLYGKGYVEDNGTCTITPGGLDDCGWSISAGFKAGGQVSAKVFGYSLLNYSADIFDYSKVIYQSSVTQGGKTPMVISNLQD